MRASTSAVVLALLVFCAYAKAAKVSENCLWGRTGASKCCKSIPNGDSTHLANPNDCSSFYVCRNNKPVLYPCSAGQVWSVDEQKCVESDNPDQCPQKQQ